MKKLKHKKLLVWWSGLLLLLGGFYFLYESAILEMIWLGDETKISFLIMFLLFVAYGRLGYIIYGQDFNKRVVTSFDLDPGYEAADQAMSLGMVGTVIGFILMTLSFTTVDFSNVDNIKELLVLAVNGMSTALYTTLSGLIASIIIRFSHYIYERTLNAKI